MNRPIFLLTVIMILPGVLGVVEEEPFGRRAVVVGQMPVTFEEVLNSHGVRAAQDSGSRFHLNTIERTMTKTPDNYVESHVVTAVDGNRLRRETSDPLCLYSRVETIDDSGRYYGKALFRKDGTIISEELPADGNRVKTICWLVETTGLLPLLREFSRESTQAYWVRHTVDDLEEFQVATPKGECTVYADRTHLIRSIKMGDVLLSFSNHQNVGSLRLPYVEQILLHGRLVREIYFSSIDFNPAFETGYFDGSTVPPERCR